MKKYLFYIVLCFSLVSCSKKVELSVFNNSEYNREHETIEICLCQLLKMDPTKIVVVDQTGRQLTTQLLYKGETTPQSIIFQVDIPAGTEYSYILKEAAQRLICQRPMRVPFTQKVGALLGKTIDWHLLLRPMDLKFFSKIPRN